MKALTIHCRILAVVAAGQCFAAFAQAPESVSLQGAVKQAIERSPEVLARYHAYKAAEGELTTVKGPLLPQVDVIANYGDRRRDDPQLRGAFREHTVTLQATQLLWDGLSTYYQSRQFSHARLVRLFEFVDASEQTALEAARAYYDVLRYRDLVSLAEDNIVEHRAVWQQIEQRTYAGVGRRVDLQQATGRMALSESNLRVETANLHDVSVRYQRIVGDPPPKKLVMPDPLIGRIPGTVPEVLVDTARINPQIRAAVENVRAATMARDSRRGLFHPRVQFRVREDRGRDINGIAGQTQNSTAEILFNFNLFSGFADEGRVAQAESQLGTAREQRDKACRDTRQTVAIAMNDMRKLDEQKAHLRQHRLSVEKARDAYRQQFEIGQRSLLDLLDTENEYFQARRAEVNATYDLELAYARIHAGVGRLLAMLELAPHDPDAVREVQDWSVGKDAPEYCPPIEIATYAADRRELDARADDLVQRRVRQLSELLSRPPLKPGAAVKPGAAPPTAVQAMPEGPEREVAEALRAWAGAWASRDTPAYLAFYAADFAPAGGGSRGDWEIARFRALKRASGIKLYLANEKFTLDEPTQVTATFHQSYSSANYRDEVEKTLVWRKQGERWRIVSETSKPLPLGALAVQPAIVPDVEKPAAAKPAPEVEPAKPAPEGAGAKPPPKSGPKPRP